MKKNTTIFLVSLGVLVFGLTGCWGNTPTPSPSPTLNLMSPLPTSPLATSSNILLPVSPLPTMLPSTSPKATTASSSKASILTLENAVADISVIKSAVVVRNGENALVGVMFDRDKYNGELTDTLEQEIIDAVTAKDSSLSNIKVTDNITYYYEIEDLSKSSGLTATQIQSEMDAIIK